MAVTSSPLAACFSTIPSPTAGSGAEPAPPQHPGGAEVTIEPDVTGFDLAKFMRTQELAAVGEQAAFNQIPKIKRLLSRHVRNP